MMASGYYFFFIEVVGQMVWYDWHAWSWLRITVGDGRDYQLLPTSQ